MCLHESVDSKPQSLVLGSSLSWNPISVGTASFLSNGQQWKQLTWLSAIIFSSWGSKVSPFSTAGQDCSILGVVS